MWMRTVISSRRVKRSAVKRAFVNVAKNPDYHRHPARRSFFCCASNSRPFCNRRFQQSAGTATPVALLAVGASFSGSEALKRIKLAIAATAISSFCLPSSFPLPLCWGSNTASCWRFSSWSAPHDGILFCDGKEHGTRRHFDKQCRHAGDGAFRPYRVTLWIFLLRSFGLL